MTNQNVNITEEQEMQIIIRFTYYCDNLLKQVKRDMTSPEQAIQQAIGYNQAINSTVGGDRLVYVYQKLMGALIGTTEQQEEGREYFSNTAEIYKEYSNVK